MQFDFKPFVQEIHVFIKTNMCSLGEFDEKTNHIKISKLLNFEPNGCKGKDSFVYTNLLIVYPLSSKFIA